MVRCRRLPGCPDTCNKLLQAALQLQDAAAVQAPSCQTQQRPTADWTEEHLHGDAQMAEAEQAPLLQSNSDVQQVALLMHLVYSPCGAQHNSLFQAQAALKAGPPNSGELGTWTSRCQTDLKFSTSPTVCMNSMPEQRITGSCSQHIMECAYEYVQCDLKSFLSSRFVRMLSCLGTTSWCPV